MSDGKTTYSSPLKRILELHHNDDHNPKDSKYYEKYYKQYPRELLELIEENAILYGYAQEKDVIETGKKTGTLRIAKEYAQFPENTPNAAGEVTISAIEYAAQNLSTVGNLRLGLYMAKTHLNEYERRSTPEEAMTRLIEGQKKANANLKKSLGAEAEEISQQAKAFLKRRNDDTPRKDKQAHFSLPDLSRLGITLTEANIPQQVLSANRVLQLA